MTIKDLQTIDVLKKYKIYNITKGLIFLKNDGIKRTINKSKGAETPLYEIDNQQFVNFENDTIYFITDSKKKYNEIMSSKKVEEFIKKDKYNFKVYLITKKYSKGEKKYNEISQFDFINNFKYKTYIFYGNNTDITKKTYSPIISDNLDLLTLNRIDQLKLYSNYCNKNNVSVRTGTFLTVDGKNFYSGGAERYLIDLNEILKSEGINLNIYQDANFPFIRKYENIDVIGLPIKKSYDDAELNLAERNISYIYSSKESSQLNIYSAFFESYPQAIHPSIGISHGIAWDHISNEWVSGINFDIDKTKFIRSAQMCDELVSVDTNTCNWFQTLDYDIGARKFNYIPNYVDINEFKPRDSYLEKGDKIIITYPRRLYEARRLYLMLDITERLVKKYKNIEVHFVGKGFDKDLKNVDKIVKKYPKSVFRYSKSPNEMYEVYQKSDISVIPTIMSEGTSLSCLEAMASGNIVVSTRIGGLSDLILNTYNGYLVEPNKEALYNALAEIIDNYEEKRLIKERAREVAKSFNKDIWKQKWKAIFDKYNLKQEGSESLELVEYHFKKIKDVEASYNIIKNELINNKLVYIYIDEWKKGFEKKSSQRLQFVEETDKTILPKHKTIDMTKKKKR